MESVLPLGGQCQSHIAVLQYLTCLKQCLVNRKLSMVTIIANVLTNRAKRIQYKRGNFLGQFQYCNWITLSTLVFFIFAFEFKQ